MFPRGTDLSFLNNAVNPLNTKNENKNNKLADKLGTLISVGKIETEKGDGSHQVHVENLKFERSMQKNMDTENLKELLEKSEFIKPEEGMIPDAKEAEQKRQEMAALSKIRREIFYGSENITSEAIAKLIASGVSIEKIDMRLLNTVSGQITERTVKDDKANKEDEINKINKINKEDKAYDASNDTLKNTDDKTIVGLLKNNKPLTAENIYAAKHTKTKVEKPITEELFDSLKKDILRIFKENDIPETKKTIEAAKLLIANEIPLDKDNIDKVLFLKNIKIDAEDLNEFAKLENYLTDIDSIVLFPDAAKYSDLKKSNEATRADLFRINENEIDNYDYHSHLTIKEILQSQKFNEANPRNNNEKSEYQQKLDFLELRMKLTYQSSARLSYNGIRIDTLTITEAINELKKAEADEYNLMLNESDPIKEEEISTRIADLFDKAKRNSQMYSRTYGDITQKSIKFSINDIDRSRAEIIKQYGHLSDLEMAPNPKYGDSFSKIAEQFGDVLASLGIEATKENIRAAKILSHNGMELNEENITDIKLIDVKLDKMTRRLNPFIAADMIQDGMNPADMHVDEINRYLDENSEKYGETATEKVAEYIAELDRSKQLSPEERDSVIAVFRMMHYIQKHGGSAIGAAVKSDRELTLGNLLDMSKYFIKSSGGREMLNQNISDDTEIVESISDEKSIKNTLQKTTDLYNKELIERFAHEINNGVLDAVFDEDSKNVLLNDLINQTDENAKQKQAAEKVELIKSIKNTPVDVLAFMSKNTIPITIRNIEIIKNIYADKNYLEKEAKKLEDEMHEAGEDKELTEIFESADLRAIKDGLNNEQIKGKIKDSLETTAIESNSPGVIRQAYTLRSIAEAICLMGGSRTGIGRMNTANGMGSHFPVMLNDSARELDVYIINEKIHEAKELTAVMNLGSSVFGDIAFIVKTSSDKADITVIAADDESMTELAENTDILNEYIKEAGFDDWNISFIRKSMPAARS